MKGEEEVPDRREATPDDASLEPAPADVEPGLQIEALLAERDPLLLLPRLIEDDPLELQARARRRLRTRAVFVCPAKVFLDTAGRIALASEARPAAEHLNPWIDDAVDSTIDALIQEQREEASRGRALEDPDDRVYYAELALAFQVSDLEARLACMVLNDLPELHRRAFFSTFYLGRSVEAFARDSDLPAAAIAKALQEVGIAVVRRIAEARRRRKGGRGGRF